MLSLRVIDKSCVPPIALANVGVPETIIAPFPEALPLIVPVIVLLAPENVAVAVAVLSVKVIAVTVTVFAKFPTEASELWSPPKIPMFVPDTVPSNFAEPPLELDPIVIVVAATLPENVIIPGATVLALLITWTTPEPPFVIAGATVLAVVALNNNVPELAIVVPETASEKVAVLLAALVIVVAATVELNIVEPAKLIDKICCVAPIALANVGLPELVTLIIPSVVAKPLIVPVIVLVPPENVAVAVPALSSKVIAVTVTVCAKLPSDASPETSPPTTLIFVAVTVPSNFADPAFVVVPIVIVSAATLRKNVITSGAPSVLSITWITVVPLSVILGDIVLAVEALNNNVP